MPVLPADDGVRAQVAGSRIGDVHRAALAFAIAHFLAEQFGEHQVHRRAFRQAMAVAAMRAGDVIVRAQRLANAHGDGFLTDIKMSQAGHQRAGVQIVDLLFEQADHHHAPVHVQMQLGAGSRIAPLAWTD